MLQHMLNYDPELLNSMDKQGKSALSYAAYMGDLDKASLLFNLNPERAFIFDKDDTYPIHQAVLGGHTNVIMLLASSKFLLNATGQNIIHVATLTGNADLVFFLLNNISEVDSLVNQKDDDGNTPLHLAALAKHVRVVELLLQDVRVKVEVLNKEGMTANDLAKKLMLDNQDISVAQRLKALLERAKTGLKCASIDGDLRKLLFEGEVHQFRQILLERRIRVEDLGCIEYGSNILHIAASMNQTSLNLVINNLLQHQFDIFMEQANNFGDLPIHSAAQAGKLKSLRTLFESSNIPADIICVRSNMKGNTALHIAVLNNQKDIADYLYRQCPQAAYSLNKDNICPLFLAINYWRESDIVTEMVNDLDGNTILHHLKDAKSVIHAAIRTRSTAILKSIVDNAPALVLDSHDSKGRSPLSYAAHIGHVEGVRCLLNKFPEIEFKCDKDEDVSFPIHQAVKGGQLQILKLFHPKNNLVNRKRQNILHVAAETGSMDVISYLLKRKEFKKLLNTGDEDGNTPLHLAAKGFSYNAVFLLTLEKHTDGNALNNELLTATDMFYLRLQHSHCQKVPSNFEMNLMYSMLGQAKGERSFLSENRGTQKKKGEKTKIVEADAKGKASVASNHRERRLTNIEKANTLLVVATLVITVTFAAAFTPPGGYNQDTGIPILQKNHAFRVFAFSNKIAFDFNIGAALILILGMNWRKLSETTLYFGGCFILSGLMFMTVAFMVGSSATPQHASEMPYGYIIASIAGTILLIVSIPLWSYVLYSTSKIKRFSKKMNRFKLRLCSQQNPHLDFTI